MGEAVESVIELPDYVEAPFEVYVNGIAQHEGTDYEVAGRTLVFPRELVPEVKLSPVKWVLVAVGIGGYRKHDSVDVVYTRDGRKSVLTGLEARRDESSAA